MSMWQEVQALIARVRGPMPKDSVGAGEVNLAVSGTAIAIVIPTWMQGKMCEFTAYTSTTSLDAGGVDVLYLADKGGTACVYQQTTAVDGTTKALTVSAATGRHIVSGQTRKWLVPKAGSGITAMSIIASAAGFIQIGLASESVQKG